ncbi:MAG TPA: ClpXP protease specificity-enhancing factor [Gammaproteobacteria bacterium]|nr:ClpXP protease specificity-enhancing factor [Gammaproteobacteria bacterium]
MLSRKPYFLRAMHQWIADSGLTPHVVVDVNVAGVEIPPGYAKDGKIVLNVSYEATQGFEIGKDDLSFSARFGGVARQVRVPLAAVLAVYAHENGQGMLFDAEDSPEDAAPGGGEGPKLTPGKKPTLKVIK